MTGGIGYEIDQLAELGVPELMRRQQVDPQLKYALALQEATKMVEAAARERDMAQPMPAPANVVGQMEANLAKRLAPGVQQQGRRSMQMRNRAAMGLPGQPAPNMTRMAMGGIVGYQEGGDVEGKSAQAPMMGDENQRRAPYLDPALEKFLVELEALNAQKDAAFPQEKDLFEQKIQDLLSTTSPRVKRLASESTFGLSKKPGMAMGGIVGYQEGGGVGDEPVEDEPFIDLGALFELIGRGRDVLFSPSRATQEAREIRRGEVEQASERGANLFNVLPPSEGLTSEQLASFDKVDVTGSLSPEVVEQRRERVESGEAARALEEQARRRAQANAARREAKPTQPLEEMTVPTRQEAFAEMFPEALSAAQRFKVRKGLGTEQYPEGAPLKNPPKKGLAGLLSRIDMDKVADVAQVLGRGAGASKGFEAAKIVEESAKARAIQEARQDQLDKLRQQLDVEREKIAATQSAAEAAATARLNQEQMRQLSDFLTSDAYATAQLQKAKELGVDISDPRVTQALEPLVRDFINKVRGGVGGMGGLESMSGISEADQALIDQYSPST